MLVVSNTSPILSLVIVDEITLLQKQFGQVQIPSAVLAELQVNQDRPGSSAILQGITAGWIQIQSVSNLAFVNVLQQKLDLGEAEAIALAIESQADLILLDERDGRKVAKSLGLKVTGVIGVLQKAYKSGDLTSLEDVIDDLINKVCFPIDPDLLKQIFSNSL